MILTPGLPTSRITALIETLAAIRAAPIAWIIELHFPFAVMPWGLSWDIRYTAIELI